MAVNFQHNARHVFVVQQNFCSSGFRRPRRLKGPCRGAEEDRTGVVIKADTVGGLEALAFELHQRNIPVRQATVGPVNKKDVLMAKSAADPLQRVIWVFPPKPTQAMLPSSSTTKTVR